MAKQSKSTYTAPVVLKPFNKEDKSVIRVVIETPKGSRNKYKFEPELGCYTLSRVLPSGMEFPYDFGFIPSTEADDGDPIDVLLLLDEAAFPGCVIESRLIGVIEGEQEQDGKKERNDRLVAVAKGAHAHSNLNDISQINPTLLDELGEFFSTYHRLEGSKFRVLGTRGPKHARQLLKQAARKSKAA